MADILISNEKNFAQASADFFTKEQYRSQMNALFGNNRAPAIRYKGGVIPERLI